ncbi:uncharacterized protein LOC121366737, partial [Gigantopelta aegis]|uniref:uncharacterized protein LOC121366737 n=1 Tax=Gigantopelta aegis TaxID=1735272 RepID=UPI001B88C7A3
NSHNLTQNRKVWIVGSSIIYWASKRAAVQLNSHLRLERLGVNISWMGRRGLKWDGAMYNIRKRLVENPPPQYIVLHVGSNDVTEIATAELCVKVERDIHSLSQSLLSSKCILVWSDLLPRLTWRGGNSVTAIEKKRKRVNRSGRKAVLAGGGRVIRHDDITFDCPQLFRSDGVHLDDIGNAIFVNTLQGALETFLTSTKLIFS